MGAETALTIAAITAVASAAAGTAGVAISAKNASDAKDDARTAATVQAKQLADQRNAEQARMRAESEKIKGRLRVMAAAAGFASEGGTYGDLLSQADQDFGLNADILDKNYQNNRSRVRSGLQAQLGEYSARGTAALASLPGIYLGSLNTGLSINNSLRPRTPSPPGG